MLNNIAEELKITVLKVSAKLFKISDSDSKVKPSPGKWSKIEILGHLVDSASNNHQRFVRAQFVDEFDGPGYMQDDWVNVQAYNERNWSEIIELWKYYNLHLAEIIRRIPENKLKIMCQLGAHEPVSLGFIAEDYLRHLKHHIGQIGIS
jgi:hypothetical protein